MRDPRQRWAMVFIVLVVVPGTLLFAHPAGAQANVQVVWSHKTAKYKFLDFGSPGIRMGDHLEARGPLLDATRTIEVGSAYLDCIAMSGITAPVGGLYRCSYVLHLKDGISGRGPRSAWARRVRDGGVWRHGSVRSSRR